MQIEEINYEARGNRRRLFCKSFNQFFIPFFNFQDIQK